MCACIYDIVVYMYCVYPIYCPLVGKVVSIYRGKTGGAV